MELKWQRYRRAAFGEPESNLDRQIAAASAFVVTLSVALSFGLFVAPRFFWFAGLAAVMLIVSVFMAVRTKRRAPEDR